jgi:putative ABC transport system permease protein
MIADVKQRLALPADYGRGASLAALGDVIVGDYHTKLQLLMAAAGLIVFLAGASVGGLLVARVVSRHQEIAVRLALGASLRQVTVLLMTESVMLAGLGGLLGILLAFSLLRGLIHLLPADTPRLTEVAINVPVLMASAAVAIATGVLAGLLPFLLARHADLQAFLRGTGLAQRSARARSLLVTFQVALAVVLLSGATLMARTLWHLERVDLGFTPRGVITFRVQPTGGAYQTSAAQNAYYDTLFSRLQAIPDVIHVGAIQHLPLSGGSWVTPIQIEGRAPVAPNESLPRVQWRFVRGAYFAALGIALRAGRPFADSEHSSDPVVIVNGAFARQFWANGNPIGRRVRIGRSPTGPWLTVVGVVGDVRHDEVARAALPELYQPHRPSGGREDGGGPAVALSIGVRVAPGADRLAEIASVARGVDRNVPVAGIEALDAAVDRSLGTTRMLLTLLGAFAAVGVLLGAVGVYGVVAYSAAQRAREFGVRLALGATPASIMRLVLQSGLRHTLGGVALGLAGASAVTQTMRTVIYGVAPNNLLMLLAVGVTLTGVGLVASGLPARLVTRRSPLDALREP